MKLNSEEALIRAALSARGIGYLMLVHFTFR